MKFEKANTAGKKTQFKDGVSGNPSGRPKGVPNTATRMQRFLHLEMAGKNPVTKADEKFTVAEMMDLQQIAKALKGDLNAYREILDRIEGKSTNKTELSGGISVGISGDTEITPEQIAAISKIVTD